MSKNNFRKEGSTAVNIVISVAILGIMLLIGFAIGAAIFGIFPFGENAPGFSSSTSCLPWGAAPDGYQDAITRAANKAKISPALLGAIFLSEHGDSWPSRDQPANGPWAAGGKGKGPFQIESWTGYWKQVQSMGYAEGRTLDEANVENMYDAGLASAVSLKVGFAAAGIIPKTSADATQVVEEKYVVFAGLWHNRGSIYIDDDGDGKKDDVMKAAIAWAEAGYDLNNPPPNTKNPGWEWGANDYAKRTWRHFQELNQDCTTSGLATNDIVKMAQSQIGVKGTGAKGDCVKYNSDFGWDCDKWCAAFVSWVYTKAGIDIKTRSAAGMIPIFSQAPHKCFNKAGTAPCQKLTAEVLEPGDVLVWNSNHHTGIVESVMDNGIIITIEGNTRNNTVKREGGNNVSEFLFAGRW